MKKMDIAKIFLALALLCMLISPIQGCTWNGRWDTTFGEMVLTQSGNTVTGKYTSSDGYIQGTVYGNVLIGTWYESSRAPPNNAGDVQLTIDWNCYSFSGNWRYGSFGDWDGSWNGNRI